MKHLRGIACCLVGGIATMLAPTSIDACSTFVLKNEGGMVFGQNYDWHIGYGMVVMNPRHAVKQGVSLAPSTRTPLVWEAKYASVSFNQYGVELPTSGMNEKGVVMALMWLNETKYPAADERPELLCLQWIQHVLDTCESVDQIVEQTESIRISLEGPSLHFLVSDAKGDSAVIEFFDGKPAVRRGGDLPLCALTNDTYASSVAFAKEHQSFGGPKALPTDPGSLPRFARAAKGSLDAATVAPAELAANAFTILDDVAQPNFTKWSIVFDPRGQKVQWRTADMREIKSLDVKSLYVECTEPRLAVDIDTAPAAQGAALLAPVAMPMNRELIGNSFGGTDFLKNTPAEVLDQLAGFPWALGCAIEALQ